MIIIRQHEPTGLYRTMHPSDAWHDGLFWPHRPEDYPIDINTGSFDVYSRLLTLPNRSSDGGAIPTTTQQWEKILKRNGNNKTLFTKWAVGGTDKIMMWADWNPYPVFHYPLCFGGNIVKVLAFYGNFALIETWPKNVDLPDEELPPWYWDRCWSNYNSDVLPIRDAPAGIGGTAFPSFMLRLAHASSAWIHKQGLIKL